MDELTRYKKSKNKKRTTVNKLNKAQLYLSKFLIVILLTITTMIILKSNNNLKETFYKEVYDKNLSFTKINELYNKYLGSFLPFDNLLKEARPVFSEQLAYKEINKYLDGASLKVNDSYLVPSKSSGLVVFIGEKEGYGNTVIIQGIDGIDIWYGNILEVNVQLYDYISEGTLIGMVKDKNLYVVFKKEGKSLDYEEYL